MTIVAKLLCARKSGIITPETYAAATEVVIGAMYRLEVQPGTCHWCGKEAPTIARGESLRLCRECAARMEREQ